MKIKIKTVQIIKPGIWEMKGGKYTKTLAKIQVRRIFRIRDIRRNVLPKFIAICMETPCWFPPGWVPTWRTETNKNICHQFWYKSGNSQEKRKCSNQLILVVSVLNLTYLCLLTDA